MNKKIKVIELLNKIANGEEVPKEIIVEKGKYRWDKIKKTYYEPDGLTTLGNAFVLDRMLNNEVEILEDNTEEIEEILYKLPEYRTSEDYDYRDIKANRILINKLVEVVEKEIRKDKSNDK